MTFGTELCPMNPWLEVAQRRRPSHPFGRTRLAGVPLVPLSAALPHVKRNIPRCDGLDYNVRANPGFLTDGSSAEHRCGRNIGSDRRFGQEHRALTVVFSWTVVSNRVSPRYTFDYLFMYFCFFSFYIFPAIFKVFKSKCPIPRF